MAANQKPKLCDFLEKKNKLNEFLSDILGPEETRDEEKKNKYEYLKKFIDSFETFITITKDIGIYGTNRGYNLSIYQEVVMPTIHRDKYDYRSDYEIMCDYADNEREPYVYNLFDILSLMKEYDNPETKEVYDRSVLEYDKLVILFKILIDDFDLRKYIEEEIIEIFEDKIFYNYDPDYQENQEEDCPEEFDEYKITLVKALISAAVTSNIKLKNEKEIKKYCMIIDKYYNKHGLLDVLENTNLDIKDPGSD